MLSSHYRCPITVNGITYPSVYHAFVAEKTAIHATKLRIAEIKNPQDLLVFEKLLADPPGWSKEFQIKKMFDLTEQKFSNPKFEAALVDTGNAMIFNTLVYHNPQWGIYRGIGENNEGVILEEVRRRKQHPITVE